MRANSQLLAPDPAGVLKDRNSFFRQGRSGSAAEVLTAEDLAAYRHRAASLATADLLDWIHHN